MTEERKRELRRLLEEAMGSLEIYYENSPFPIPAPVYRMYLEERWAYYGIEFLLQAFSVQFGLKVANRQTQLKLRAFIKEELAPFIRDGASPDFNLVCVKQAEYRIEGDSTDARRVYGSGLGDLPLFMLIERLLELALVRGTEEAVSIFERYSRGAGTHIFHRVIALLEGIELESMIEVYPGARLVPLPSPVISGKMERCLIGLPMRAFVNEKDSFFGRALLVIDCPGLSIFHRPSERAFQDGTQIEDLPIQVQIPDVKFMTWDARHSFKDIFLQALSLVCDSAIETVFEAWLFEQDRSFVLHLGGSNMLRYANRSNTSAEVEEAQINEAKRLYEVLDKKPDLRERLQIPIERWKTSKTSNRDVDKIIDLGIALEALYVSEPHPKGKGKDWQIRHHASAYLKTDSCPQETLKKEFQEIYRWRSVAVHKGRLPRKKISKAKKTPYTREEMIVFIQRAQDLCRDSILKIIKEEQFPDWQNLVAGGDS